MDALEAEHLAFQSHLGSISTARFHPQTRDSGQFQSHLGSISTRSSLKNRSPRNRFQSHLGSISTGLVGRAASASTVFQSHLGSISTHEIWPKKTKFRLYCAVILRSLSRGRGTTASDWRGHSGRPRQLPPFREEGGERPADRTRSCSSRSSTARCQEGEQPVDRTRRSRKQSHSSATHRMTKMIKRNERPREQSHSSTPEKGEQPADLTLRRLIYRKTAAYWRGENSLRTSPSDAFLGERVQLPQLLNGLRIHSQVPPSGVRSLKSTKGIATADLTLEYPLSARIEPRLDRISSPTGKDRPSFDAELSGGASR